MHINMSNLDRAIRAGIAVTALVVAIIIGAGSTGGILLLVVTALMAATAAVGFCPLYAIFHFDSRGQRPLPHRKEAHGRAPEALTASSNVA
jgi:fatty acid desaturase